MKKSTLGFLNLLCIPLLLLNWSALAPHISETNCVVDLGDDVELQLGDTYLLEALTNCNPSEIESITWTPAIGLSCEDCLDPLISPIENICYTITIEMQDGCISTDEICIMVRDCAPDYTNSIDDVDPQPIVDIAEVKLEVTRTQYTYLEIVDNDEVQFSLWEGWLRAGVRTISVDFSEVPSGTHELRARLYPENVMVTIQKQ